MIIIIIVVMCLPAFHNCIAISSCDVNTFVLCFIADALGALCIAIVCVCMCVYYAAEKDRKENKAKRGKMYRLGLFYAFFVVVLVICRHRNIYSHAHRNCMRSNIGDYTFAC